MLKRFRKLGLLGGLALASAGAHAQTQATLGTTNPYVETFDNLGSAGLPAGFNVYTGATATALGTAPAANQLFLAPGTSTAWANTTGGFKNFASATSGLAATASTADQTAAANRALGVRQTGSFGDGTSSTGAGPAFAFKIDNTTGKTDFALSFKLQSLDNSTAVGRTTTWRVDYGIGATPSAFTQVGTTTYNTLSAFASTTITASFGGALDNQGGPVWIRIVAPTQTSGSGSRPSSAIDDFSLSWQTNSTAPQLSAAPGALAFGNQTINTPSAPQTYTLTGNNLTGDATVTATAPFSVSKDGVTYGLTATYTVAELAAGPKPVYVRFTPTTSSLATGPVSGSITNSSAGAATRTVTATGAGVDPTQTVYSFNNCVNASNLSDGWTQFSVNGAQTWACTTFGRDPGAPSGTAAYPSAVQMNGYSGGNVTNEDWLISPSLSLASTTYPLFSFWSRTAFAGPQLRLLVSTNYSGTGSPVAAGVTWTDLNATFPGTASDVWTQTANVDLSAYKTAGVYVAFVYKSTTDEAARWTIDDVVLTNSATPAPPAVRLNPASLSYGYRAVGSSTTQTLNVTATSLTGDLTVTSSNAAFQVSKDGTTFGSSVTYTTAEASGKIVPVRVRFQPTAASTTYSAVATVTTSGATSQTLNLSGNTYDVANTLEVVNWNMEWFGSPAAGFGPDDKTLQFNNAKSVLSQLNADVYALLEVVDTVRLNNLVAAMPGYAYRVSYFGSAADDSVDADYRLTQKLAFVYRTSVIKNPKFTAFFRSRQAQNLPDYSYWSSGRFPFVMQADVVLNGATRPTTFVAIHAKANTDPVLTSYNRRKLAADELKTKLDADYAGKNVIVLGDFNDDLDQTITAGISPPITSYSAFTNDAVNYPSPTLQELSLTGQKSTVDYNDVIDHVVTSKSLYASYIKGTTEVQTGVASTIANYGSTTSDHYPVLTRYAFVANNLLVNTAGQTVTADTYDNVTVTNTGQGTLQGPLVVTGTLTVQSGGSLDTNCQPITGGGSFTVADGGTLSICNAAGIAASGSTGAVQVTGTRSFSPAASYVYNGTAAQVTGSGLPSQVLNLTSTNANSLTLTQPVAVTQVLTVGGSGNVVLNNQALTLLSSATSTALVVNSGTGTVQGAATVQRYLDGSRNAGPGYRQLSAPVSNTTVADLATANFTPVVNPAYNTSATPNTVTPYPTVYGYDESRLVTTTNNTPLFDKGWYSPVALTDPLVVAKGYTVNMPANQVVDFVGTLNNGTYSQTLTRQSQAADGGWQLVGNPYPAPLSSSQISAADRPNLDAAIYISQSTGQYTNTYRSYVNGIGGVGSIVPLGQAFFMRVSAGQSSGTLTLRNSQRSTSYAAQVTVQRTTGETRPVLNLTLAAANGSADALYVYAEAGATAGFDQQQDAAKLPNPTGLNLAALTSAGEQLSIQGLPALAGRVALHVQVPAAGTYSLAAAELLNIAAGTQPVLEDTKTGQRTPLVAVGSTYTFTVAAGENLAGRFWLNLTAASPLATASALQTELALYPNPTPDGQATLLVPAGTAAGQVQVLDALGRLVRQQPLAAGGATTLKLAGLPAGVYVVRVQAGSEQATRRLTIK
jgi:hypothetical protein